MAAACNSAQAQTTDRASLATGGVQGDSSSDTASISADGRFVAFHSVAANLVPGDANGVWDVFVHDRQTGTTELVSTAMGGGTGNHGSLYPSISRDARFVTFASFATNLVPADGNGVQDVFVRDRLNATTELVSRATNGAPGDRQSGYHQAISDDGRFVAFCSEATNLVVGDTNGYRDTFVRDRFNGTTARASVSTTGAQANYGVRYELSISADGRFVVFDSLSTNLAAGDWNSSQDVFLRDLLNGTTERISVNSAGEQGDGDSLQPSLSADGRFVAFVSSASNLAVGDTNEYPDIFVRDRQDGTTKRVSLSSGGQQGNRASRVPTISADGRFVAFESDATNLVAGDTNWWEDVFVHDRTSGAIERMSLATSGVPANARNLQPAISADSRFVTFHSSATNLVALDTNASLDVFVRDFGGRVAYCFGDGTGTACPCGQGATGAGCPSSVNAAGGNLVASGTSSTTNDTIVLRGTAMPNNTAVYLQGATRAAGGAGIVFGDGLRCIGGATIRLGMKQNVGGASQYPAGGDPPVSVRGLVTAPGVRRYQIWYRNAADFCTAATFNLTNGVEIVWVL